MTRQNTLETLTTERKTTSGIQAKKTFAEG